MDKRVLPELWFQQCQPKTGTGDPSESFGYDTDGNLTVDGTYTYVWDGENRLAQVVTTRTGNPQSGDRMLEFKYDYMGRRVEKTYSTYNGSVWVMQSQLRFVYDDWNVVLVLDGQTPTCISQIHLGPGPDGTLQRRWH